MSLESITVPHVYVPTVWNGVLPSEVLIRELLTVYRFSTRKRRPFDDGFAFSKDLQVKSSAIQRTYPTQPMEGRRVRALTNAVTGTKNNGFYMGQKGALHLVYM